jgi:hypothetical protein
MKKKVIIKKEMDVVANLLDVLTRGKLVMARPMPPPHQLHTRAPDITASQFVVSGDRLHAFAVHGESGVRYFRPQGDTVRAWMYVHKHFGLPESGMQASVVWKKLNTPEHRHIMDDTNGAFNLHVMCILGSYAQNTPYTHHFSFHSAKHTNVDRLLELTSNKWFRHHDLDFRVIWGGQALAHVLMGNPDPASHIDVWVQTHEQVQVLIDKWRHIHKESLILGVRPGGVIVVCLPRVRCSCIVRVVPASDTYNELWSMQPDFTQCVYDGETVIATPRCILAMNTRKSEHPPDSRRAWLSKESGLTVTPGVKFRGKPMVINSDHQPHIAWELLSQFGCTGISLTPSTDSMLFTSYAKENPGVLGFGTKHVEMQSFLQVPRCLEEGVSLFIRIDRMYVEKSGDETLIRNDASSEVKYMDALVSNLMACRPGHYTPTPLLEVRFVDKPEHASSGAKMDAPPPHTSVSGTVWWNTLCVRDNTSPPPHTLFFNVTSARVHPPHLPLQI